MSDLTELNRPYDPFADIGDDDEVATPQNSIHLRIQQRNGKKTITSVQGIPKEYDLKRLLKAFKKDFACNGTVVDDKELGQVLQLTGDQRLKTTSTGQQGVKSLDVFVGERFGQGLWASCKDIKFGASNGYAMDLIAPGAQGYLDMLRGLGKESPLGSPFQIDFPEGSDPSGQLMQLDRDTKQCNDTDIAYRCSCVDCESTCPTLPKTPAEQPECRIGGTLRCWSFGLMLTYLLIVGVVVFWLAKRNGWLKQLPWIGRRGGEIALDTTEDGATNGGQRHRPFFERLAMAEAEEDRLLDPDATPSKYRLHSFLQDFFYQIGYFCSTYPQLTIMATLVFVILASLGWLRFQIERGPVNLWVPPTSPALQQKQYFDEHFSPFYRTTQIIISSVTDEPLLTYDRFMALFDLEKDIAHVKSTPDNVTINDICLKPTDGACAVQSITGYFGDDKSNVDKTYWKDDLHECAFTPTNCLTPSGQPLKPELVFGAYNASSWENARALIVTYVIKNSVETDWIAKAEQWEAAVREHVLDSVQDRPEWQGVKIAYSTESSLEIELNKSSNTDAKTVVISYLVMFLYASLALGKVAQRSWRRVLIDSKFSLAVSGILIVIASVSVSVGIFSLTGRKTTLIIAEVIPFLVLAVGVDNIFILVHEFHRRTAVSPTEPVEVRVARTVGKMGPSIFLSALAETIAFGLGGVVTMPAVSSFAMVAAMAVAVDFLLQVTCFVACMTLDAKRAEANRLDIIPCMTIEAPEDTESEGLLQKWTRKYYAPFLFNRTVRYGICLAFLGLWMVGLSLAPRVPLGLDQRIALPGDSYLVDYFNSLDQYFGVGPPVYFVVKSGNVTVREGQQKLCGRFSSCDETSLPNVLEQERKRSAVSYIAEPSAGWLDDFFYWLNPNIDCCVFKKRKSRHSTHDADVLVRAAGPRREMCGPFDMPDDCEPCKADWSVTMEGLPEGSEFIDFLDLWINMIPGEDCPLAGKAAYGDAVVYDSESKSVLASHFRTFHTPLRSQNDYIKAYDSAHRISDGLSKDLGLDVFPYSVFYVFFEQYSYIIKMASQILGLAILSIFVITSFLLGSLRTGAIVMLVVCMILTDVIGIMTLWDVSLNAVSLVNLVICVGISVEFCCHIARAFVIGSGTRQERAFNSLSEIGSSVFSGITLTKFCGIVVLAFTKSKIFEVYYFRMYLAIVVMGALHGLVLLPVLLAMFGGEGTGLSDSFDEDGFAYNTEWERDRGNGVFLTGSESVTSEGEEEEEGRTLWLAKRSPRSAVIKPLESTTQNFCLASSSASNDVVDVVHIIDGDIETIWDSRRSKERIDVGPFQASLTNAVVEDEASPYVRGSVILRDLFGHIAECTFTSIAPELYGKPLGFTSWICDGDVRHGGRVELGPTAHLVESEPGKDASVQRASHRSRPLVVSLLLKPIALGPIDERHAWKRAIEQHKPVPLQFLDAIASMSAAQRKGSISPSVFCNVSAKSVIHLKVNSPACYFLQLEDVSDPSLNISLVFKGDRLLSDYHGLEVGRTYLFSRLSIQTIRQSNVGKRQVLTFRGKSSIVAGPLLTTSDDTLSSLLANLHKKYAEMAANVMTESIIQPAVFVDNSRDNATIHYEGTVTRILDIAHGLYVLDDMHVLSVSHHTNALPTKPFRVGSCLLVQNVHVLRMSCRGTMAASDTEWRRATRSATVRELDVPLYQCNMLIACTLTSIQLLHKEHESMSPTTHKCSWFLLDGTSIVPSVGWMSAADELVYGFVRTHLWEKLFSGGLKCTSMQDAFANDSLNRIAEALIAHQFSASAIVGKRDIYAEFFDHKSQCKVAELSKWWGVTEGTYQLSPCDAQRQHPQHICLPGLTTIEQLKRYSLDMFRQSWMQIEPRFENQIPEYTYDVFQVEEQDGLMIIGRWEANAAGQRILKDTSGNLNVLVIDPQERTDEAFDAVAIRPSSYIDKVHHLCAINTFHIVCERSKSSSVGQEIFRITATVEPQHMLWLPTPDAATAPDSILDNALILFYTVQCGCATAAHVDHQQFDINVIVEAEAFLIIDERARSQLTMVDPRSTASKAFRAAFSSDACRVRSLGKSILGLSMLRESIKFRSEFRVGSWTLVHLTPERANALADQIDGSDSEGFMFGLQQEDTVQAVDAPWMWHDDRVSKFTTKAMSDRQAIVSQHYLSISVNVHQILVRGDGTTEPEERSTFLTVRGIVAHREFRPTRQDKAGTSLTGSTLGQDIMSRHDLDTGLAGRTVFVSLQDLQHKACIDVYIDTENIALPDGLMPGATTLLSMVERRETEFGSVYLWVSTGSGITVEDVNLSKLRQSSMRQAASASHITQYNVHSSAAFAYLGEFANVAHIKGIRKVIVKVIQLQQVVLRWSCNMCGMLTRNDVCPAGCPSTSSFSMDIYCAVEDGTGEAKVMAEGERDCWKLLQCTTHEAERMKRIVFHIGELVFRHEDVQLYGDRSDNGAEAMLHKLCTNPDIHSTCILYVKAIHKHTQLRRVNVVMAPGTLSMMAPHKALIKIQWIDTCIDPLAQALFLTNALEAQHPVQHTLQLVTSLLESIMATNDRLPQRTLTHFHSRAIPSIGVGAYLQRILKFAPFANEVLISVLVYFDHIASPAGKEEFVITSWNIHRLLIAAIAVAAKFSSDIFYTNARYAKVGGLPLHEMNQLEMEFLFLCNFNLYVRMESLQEYGDQLLKHHSDGDRVSTPIPTIPIHTRQSSISSSNTPGSSSSSSNSFEDDQEATQTPIVTAVSTAVSIPIQQALVSPDPSVDNMLVSIDPSPSSKTPSVTTIVLPPSPKEPSRHHRPCHKSPSNARYNSHPYHHCRPPSKSLDGLP
ncbi:hypothetical protein BZG36_03924 [Bifiguratus adelaidae]|uniref:SSD domain-containing protein n=1 Tax=Bifiguratus adelaidae TaxID=1938954 RepID=A0A261XZ42_9FUNG|nr:hypothetical protein BZG36_03924 [Bifiguratus adelaidae]